MRREEYINDADDMMIFSQQSMQARMWTAIPAIITEVDYTRFTVTLQPAIRGRIEDQDGQAQLVDLPLLVDVPVLFPNAGGWHMTFPIKPGDECLAVFSCRCIDAWWQNGGVQNAMERRMHDLSDAFAVLAPYSQPMAQQCAGGYSDSSVILRNDAKDNYFEFTNDGCINILHQKDLDSDTLGNADIYIKGNCTVAVDGNVTTTVKGTMTATVDGDVTLSCKSNVTETVDGNITLTCKSSVTADISGELTATITGTAQIKAATLTVNADSVTVNSPTTTFNGNVSVNGTVASTGSVSTGGSVTAAGNVTGGSISLNSHRHGGVETGPGTTGGPQ